MLTIQNHGSLIVESNYWTSPLAKRGLLYMSVNAGACRLLVPHNQRHIIDDMRQGAKYIVVSYLPQDKWEDGKFCVEWLVEDDSDTPFALHLSPGQIDRIASADNVGKEWIASVWDDKKGRPHKCLERPAYCQIVPHLPWLKKIENK